MNDSTNPNPNVDSAALVAARARHQEAQARLLEHDAVATANLSARREAAEARNADGEQEAETRREAIRQEVASLETALRQEELNRDHAIDDAAAAAPLAGFSLDHQALDPEQAFRPRRMGEGAAMSAAGLERTAKPRPIATYLLAAFGAITAGFFTAVAWGTKMGMLEPELSENFTEEHRGALILFWFVCAGLLFGLGVGVAWVWHRAAAARVHRGGWRGEAATWLVAAVILLVTLWFGDAFIQMLGYRAVAEASFSEVSLPDTAYFLMGVVTGGACFLAKFLQGYQSGLHDSTVQRASDYADHEARQEEERRRKDANCQRAASMIAQAARLRDRVREREAELAQAKARLDAVRAETVPVPAEPTEEEKRERAILLHELETAKATLVEQERHHVRGTTTPNLYEEMRLRGR